MNFIGRIHRPKRGEKYWEVRIPDVGIFTQGKSEKDARAMTVDAIKTVVDVKNFKVKIHALSGGRLLITADNPTPLVARWLFRLRIKNHLTIRQAAERLGASSPEAWARYESGRASLVHAIDPQTKITFQGISLAALKRAI